MSSLIVEVCTIDEINEHPNADRLELATVKGWQCVVQKDAYKSGDIVVYAPIDSMLPFELSEKMNVTQYLSKQRVKTVKLRGEYSQGLIIPMEFLPGDSYQVGDDVLDELGITKYVPHVHMNMGPNRPRFKQPKHPMFPEYTSIENIKNFSRTLKEGEEVIITEKIHGTSFRAGIVDGELLVGTHHTIQTDLTEEIGDSFKSPYWKIAKQFKFGEILTEGQIVYGEIYGAGIQKGYHYDLDSIHVRLFDLMVNLRYVSYGEFELFCETHGLPYVPVIYRGPWSKGLMSLANGKSSIAGHIKEGFVVRPFLERWERSPGRVILKHISEEYLLKKKPDTIPH